MKCQEKLYVDTNRNKVVYKGNIGKFSFHQSSSVFGLFYTMH